MNSWSMHFREIVLTGRMGGWAGLITSLFTLTPIYCCAMSRKTSSGWAELLEFLEAIQIQINEPLISQRDGSAQTFRLEQTNGSV